MNNRAATFTEFVGWAIGIFIVIVILFLIFAPNQLFAKVRDQAINFGFGLLPEQKKPEFQGKTEIPLEVQNYFGNLLSQIMQQNQKKNCTVDLGEIPSNDKFSIVLYNDMVQIESGNVEVGDKSALTPQIKTESMQGFRPCEVSGIAALNLHGCFVLGQERQCNDMSKASSQISLEKNKYSRYALRDEKGLCLINIYEDSIFDFGRCDPPRYDGMEGFDSDCIKFLEAKLC